MPLDTQHPQTTVRALEASVTLHRRAFEERQAIQQKVCFKLLRRRLRDFGQVARGLDATPIKDLLRVGAQRGLLPLDEVERWFGYCNNRIDTAHDYGDGFAQETLLLIPDFIRDVMAFEARLHPESPDSGTPN